MQFAEDEHGQHEIGVFLRPDYRSGGLESTLVEVGVEFAGAWGIENVWLTAGPADFGAFYEDVGFAVDELDGSFGVLWMLQGV